VRLARRPLERFLRIQAAGGLVLIFCALVALAVASSPYGPAYARFWSTPIAVEVGALRFVRPLDWVVNDGLMAIFFFVVGMEIRRESVHGELSEWRRAALPAAAALGGMLAPALLYLLVVRGAPDVRAGWGVPMATDIAFAVGVLALLGRRGHLAVVAAHPFQRGEQALAPHRLQQIVPGFCFEGRQRVVVVGGTEHHRRW